MLERDDSEEHILEELFQAELVIEVSCIRPGCISQGPGSAVPAAR